MEPNQTQFELLKNEAKALVTKSASLMPAERAAAEKELKERASELLEPLLILNEEAMIYHRKHNKNSASASFRRIMFAVIFCVVLLPISIIAFTSPAAMWVLVGVIILAIPLTIFLQLRNKEIHKYYANALRNYRDLRVIGPLAEALFFDNENQFRSKVPKYADLCASISNSLECITKEDEVVLSGIQLDCLIKALNPRNTELSLAILQKMPFIGNRKVLEVVRMRAVRSWNKSVVIAAQQCLPGLEARVLRIEATDSLLRASSPAEISVSTLLRPALSTSEAASDDLLRPAPGE